MKEQLSRKKASHDTRNYQKTQMQKDMIIEKLREQGCRITKQRLTIIDIILQSDCTCCKEIYYKASKIDDGIGSATVYRMINTLEEIGAISRKNMYKIAYSQQCGIEDACTVVLDDNTTYNLSAKTWNHIIKAGMEACGYLKNQNIASVSLRDAACGGCEG